MTKKKVSISTMILLVFLLASLAVIVGCTRTPAPTEKPMGTPASKPAPGPGNPGMPPTPPKPVKTGTGQAPKFYGMDPDILKDKEKLIPKKIRDTGGAPDLQKEEKFLKELVKKEPENVKALYLLGLNQFHQQKFEDAIEYFDKILKLEPKNEKAIETRAYCYFLLDEMGKARELAKEGLKLYPKNARLLHITAAVAYYGDCDPKAARKIYENARKIDPDDPLLEVSYALSFFGMRDQDHDKGFEVLKKAVKKYPDYPQFYVLLAEEQHNVSGESRKAIKTLSTAKQLDPKDYNVDQAVGEIYADLDQPERALSYYKAALKKNPTNVGEVYIRMARAYEAMGQDDKAEEYYLKVIDSHKNDSDASYEIAGSSTAIARFLIKRNKLDKAKEYIDKAFNSFPLHEHNRYTKALWLLKQNKLDEAEKEMLASKKDRPKMITATPEQYMYDYGLAMVYAKKGEKDKTIEHLKLALENDPLNKLIVDLEKNEYFDGMKDTEDFNTAIKKARQRRSRQLLDFKGK